ncbi:MAG TPA: YfhO family protein [Thermoanaerobaculia bacterium]|nr:YfhO family protein [Thermoanaerobaculia bacterium]
MNVTFLYLAAIYLVAVFCWRRLTTTVVPWPAATFFYLLVLIFLFKPLTGAYDSVPSDFPLGLYPWVGEFPPPQNLNPEINDVILQLVPWAHQVRESWKNFEAPLWNAAAGAGYPLLGNGQSSPFSPFRLLGLPLPLGQSLTLEAALKLLVALTGAYLYMRRRGYSDAAAILTAVSFAFCTFQIVWLHFPLAAVSVFLPSLFLAVDLVFEKPSYRRFLFCSMVFLMLLVNGQPEMAAHSVLIVGIYLLWLLATEQRWTGRLRSVAAIALAGIVALVLALPVLLPFLEALPLSQRYDFLQSTGLPLLRLDPRFLVLFVQPQFYGTFANRHIWGPGNAEFICGYAGVFAVAAWIAFVVHFIRHRSFRDPLFFFVWAAPLLLWIIMGWPYLSDAFHHIPIFSMAANGRLRMVLCWCIAVLAGAAVDRLLEREERGPMLIGIITISGALLWIFTHQDFPNAQELEEGFITAVPRIAVLLVGLLAIFATRLRLPLKAATGLLIAVVAFDLLAFAIPWSPVVEAEDMFPMTHLLRAMHHHYSLRGASPAGPFRIAGTGANFFPNSAAMYGLEDIRAHDPMANTRSLGALRIFAGYKTGDYFAQLSKVDHPLIDFLNVRFVITSPYEYLPSDHFGLVYSGADGRIYQNLRVLPRFYPVRTVIVQFNDVDRMNAILTNRDWEHSVIVKRLPTWLVDRIRGDLFAPLPENAPMARVTIIRSSAREHALRIKAPRWTFIASSQPQWPGWRIYRGDEEIKTIEMNGLFIGFLAPPGDSEMRMVYHPRSFYMGLYTSLSCAAVLLFLLFRDNRRQNAEFRMQNAE